MMLYKQFKIQPVQAFYKLFIFTVAKVFLVATILSLLYFLILKYALLNSVSKNAIEQMSEIVSEQQKNPSDMVTQTKNMQELILKNPNIINLAFAGLALFIIIISYTLAVTQRILKSKIMGETSDIKWILSPFKESLNILIYILLFFPITLMVVSLAFVSLKSNPVFSIISILFLIMVVVRSVLFVPGTVIGEMSFGEALKYSFQTISGGRAFKITIFGFLIFLVISLLLQIILNLPMRYLNFDNSFLFFNILVIFLQIGVISVGLASLFTRYGNFEEQTEV